MGTGSYLVECWYSRLDSCGLIALGSVCVGPVGDLKLNSE